MIKIDAENNECLIKGMGIEIAIELVELINAMVKEPMLLGILTAAWEDTEMYRNDASFMDKKYDKSYRSYKRIMDSITDAIFDDEDDEEDEDDEGDSFTIKILRNMMSEDKN